MTGPNLGLGLGRDRAMCLCALMGTATDCLLQIVCCRLSAGNHPLLTVDRTLSIAGYPLKTVYCRLSIAGYPSQTSHHRQIIDELPRAGRLGWAVSE